MEILASRKSRPSSPLTSACVHLRWASNGVLHVRYARTFAHFIFLLPIIHTFRWIVTRVVRHAAVVFAFGT